MFLKVNFYVTIITMKSKQKLPLVSVLMATYNDEKYVADTINSVLSQDFEDFEFIIINDGSTDNTSTILQAFASRDERIKIINQENQGLVSSLNRGLDLAKGKYIARIDGDDQWLPHKLREQVSYAQAHPNVVLISGAREEINPDSVPFSFVLTGHTHEQNLRAITIINPFTHASAFFDKKIAIKCGKYPDMCPIEDYALFSKMLQYGESYIMPYPIIRYRSNPSGISQTRSKEQAQKSNLLSKQNWKLYPPSVLSRSEIVKQSRQLLESSVTPEFGISLKHYFLFINTRIGYRMLKQKQFINGFRQLLNIASTGRTGLSIVLKHGKNIIKN